MHVMILLFNRLNVFSHKTENSAMGLGVVVSKTKKEKHNEK